MDELLVPSRSIRALSSLSNFMGYIFLDCPRTRRPPRPPDYNIMQHLLTDMQNSPHAWPFAKPVSIEEVTDYYDVIKSPMDLETMEAKLEANLYPELETFLADARLMFENCRMYNAEGSNYVKVTNRVSLQICCFIRLVIIQRPRY